MTAIRAFVCLLLPAVLVALDEPEKKVFGEPKPDQALVYVIRPDGPGLSDKVGTWVFADKAVVAHLKGNSYNFGYVPPGRHLIWGFLAKELEFVPGQVYYLRTSLSDISLLSEEEGKAFIAQTKSYRPLDAEHKAEGEQKAAKDYEKVKSKLATSKYAARRRARVEELPPPTAPPVTEGLLRVPAYSPVKVELMETVTSRLNKPGETVWFRVAEDAAVEGKAWLRAGTPVKGTVTWADASGGGGKSGSLDVRIAALPGPEGTPIPAVGQLVSAAKSRTGAAAVGFALGGFLGQALVKGREDYHVAGSPFNVFTRGEAWTAPAGEAPAPPEPPAATLTAKPVQPLRFAPASRDLPAPVSFTIDRSGDRRGRPDEGGRLEGPRSAEGHSPRARPWRLDRQLPGMGPAPAPAPSSAPVPLLFQLTRGEGEPVVAAASVSWNPEE